LTCRRRPLVGNFTDRSGDGKIDLCDTPDVLVTVCNHHQRINASTHQWWDGKLTQGEATKPFKDFSMA